MSARDRGVSTEIPAALDAEGPLRRWSRRKREAVREREAADEARRRDPARAPSEAVQDAREPAGDAPAPAAVEEKDPTDEDMPPIDSLDENSDYSGFLSPGVSEGLRRRALRKLFMSAVFNVRDGLDDYDEDFTNFEALGDIVTSDMRHQAEAESERARLRASGYRGGGACRGRLRPRRGGADRRRGRGMKRMPCRADAAGMPGASGHRPSEGARRSRIRVGRGCRRDPKPGTATGEAVADQPARFRRRSVANPIRDGRAMAGTAAESERVVATGPENGDAAGRS